MNNKKSASEKYNIIFIILLFVIPLISLNTSFYFLSNINLEWALKEQEKKAIQEAETLSSEADFGLQIESHFGKFFEAIKKSNEDNLKKDSLPTEDIEKSVQEVFTKPFPEYNLYVFKTSINTSKTELLYYKGDLKSGKRGLCLAFEHLYNLNNDIEIDSVKRKNNETFAKMLFGKYTNIMALAKDLRGISTFSNGIHKTSWFIWDYSSINENEVLGAFLICSELNNHEYYGRLLALKNLHQRSKIAGAFIPVYKDYGEACIPNPLNKSKTFLEWAKNITIQDQNEMEKWLKDSLPQRVSLGNYTGFCHLGRGATHIAVVLIKSIKDFAWPKWLISINILFLLILSLILAVGIAFKKWPQISLTTRFTLSYFLASVLPLSLICVSAYGYMLEYKNTIINQTTSDLMSALKSFDHQKSESVKKYKMAFTKALNDERLADIIKEKGIEDEAVAQRVIDIFENINEKLPVLGVKILDEAGDGAFLRGGASSSYSIKPLVNSIVSSQVKVLRDRLIEENPDAEKTMKEYKGSQEEDLDNTAYESLTGYSLQNSMNKHFSVPVARKNGNLASVYQIFDFVRIDGNIKYMLFVIWDDKTIDDKIIQTAFDNYSSKPLKNKQSFVAYRINGQGLEYIGKKIHYSSENLIKKVITISKLTINSKKTDDFIEDDNLIVALPAVNFNQSVFVAWISIFDILEHIVKRVIIFIVLIIFSFIILWLCSRRSAAVFLKPVSALKEGLDEVSTGNLKVSFKNEPKDELGNLSNEFSKMIEGLIEKERLSKIISDQALQAIEKNSNGLLNDTETFRGVALVSDIRNFTGTSEKYEATMITDLLNEHFAEMTKIISENGGLIYKFIGDAIEAVFLENKDYKENAILRAFRAGSMMIEKLDTINLRREKVGLFPYKIGVGLCCGTMNAGTIGSLETRLDYAILGDPLKNAAKYEALSIQNPDFPLVFGEDIAKEVEKNNISHHSIDSKGQNFKVYTVERKSVKDNQTGRLQNDSSANNDNSEKEAKDYKIFALQDENKRRNYNNFWLNIVISTLVVVVILLGSNTIYLNKLDSLKDESEKECQRLCEQLKCDEVLKSAFETLCFDYSEDIANALNDNNNNKSKKQKVEEVLSNYEKSGRSIPFYCCCIVKDNSSEIEDICHNGFSLETCQKIASLAHCFKNEKDGEASKEKEAVIWDLMGKQTNAYHISSSHYRRSAIATIDEKEMYIDTNMIYDINHEKMIGYVFFGIPEENNNHFLPQYYTSLAKDHVLLALHNNNDWYFSDNFPKDEQDFIKNNYNNLNLIEEKKGYVVDNMKNGNENTAIYSITAELASYYRPIYLFNLYLVLIIILVSLLLVYLIRKSLAYFGTTVAVKLRTDIIASAILPLLTVGFVSYLLVNEDYSVKKSELRSNLNKLMDEVEEREFYYQPLCQTYLRKLSRSPEIQKFVYDASNSKNEKERKAILGSLWKYLDDNVHYRNYRKKNFDSLDPHFIVSEILVVGKNDWTVGVSRKINGKKSNENNISDFAKILSKAGKSVYFDNHKNNAGKVDVNEAKDEMIAEKVVEGYGSMFGSEFAHKIVHFTDNLVCISVTFSAVGIYISPLPNLDDPDYIMFVFIFFDNELKPLICNIRNDVFPYKKHIASGGVGEKLYCFYSPHLNVGDYFFYDDITRDYTNNNKREDLKTVKEFGLASSWLNTSYLPISRKVNLYGPHFLEARRGNFVGDNLYIALGSEIPLQQNALNKLHDHVWVILLSIVMIFFIAQSVILDLLEPIKQLIIGARQAAKGDYKYRTDFSRKDELGTLCNSFDKMMKGLEEKQLMNSMVSKSALKETSNSADSISKKINAVLLYVSVPGFDKVMKSLSSNEVFMKLREQVAIIADLVTKNGGDIDKIMGEKLLIAFHLGNKSPEEVAVTASKVAYLIETEPKLHFKVAVGVNYGQVISGYLGVGQKRDFTIIGDSVNVTARIASFAEELESNKCVVSESVMSLIKNKIKTEEYGEVQFKGKALPAKVYRII